VNKDNFVKDNNSGTVLNCILESVVKDQYFGKVQLRTLGISQYILGFVECVDGITEEYVQAFIL
jgi:hypothetical protein